jgi:hypothetical protein
VAIHAGNLSFTQQELELYRGGRQIPMSMKGRSHCVVACLFPITVLLS